MANQFLNPQNQLSSHNFSHYIQFRSLGFSILFKEQNLIFQLRGGGCKANKINSDEQTITIQNQVGQVKPIQEISVKQDISYQQYISLIQIINLILQNSIQCQQNQISISDRDKAILQEIPQLISNYERIQNEMLSLLIFEQLGSVYQSEFENIIYKIDSQGFQLEGLKYQHEIMKTAIQQKQRILQDQHFQELLKLPSQLNNNPQLIDNLKNIEMQLSVSEQNNYKEYSSLMIYKQKQIFEMLLWIFKNQDKDIVLEYLHNIYNKDIVNSKSIHIYNQWITLISNLYLIRKFEDLNKDQKIEIIKQIRDRNYLQFQIQEKQYFKNQISIIKEKLIKNLKNYQQSEAIYPLLQHIQMEQQTSDSQIAQLKNSYINIIIDKIRILISYNSFYNQCTFLNNFENRNLQQFQQQFQEIENNLRNDWEIMILRIEEKIAKRNPSQQRNFQINPLQQIKLEQQIQVNFQKENKSCLLDALNYYRKLILIFINVMNQAYESLKKKDIEFKQKIKNYLLIIFTIELIQKVNNYYLVNLKQIYLQLLNLDHNVKGISETIELFKKIIRQETYIKNLFKNDNNNNNQLFSQEIEIERDRENLQELSLQKGEQMLNKQQKQILQELPKYYCDNQLVQINLPQHLDLENYNQFILFVLQLFQYPQQFRLSFQNRRQMENLVLQLIKILTICYESYTFEFALELLLDVWLENKFNKLMLDGKIVELIEKLENIIKPNIEKFRGQIQLAKFNEKIIELGKKQLQELYVKNKIKFNLLQEDTQQLEEKFNKIFQQKIEIFLQQFSGLQLNFDYKESLISVQQNLNNNNLNLDEIIKLRQAMILEQKLQNIQKDKYFVDLMCKNLNSQENIVALKLNEEIKNFIQKANSKILIIYGEDGPGKIHQIQEFLWQQYNNINFLIPVIILVNIDNLQETKLKQIILQQLSLNSNKILFLIIIQEDYNQLQIIESIKLMNLIVTRSYPESKILCLIKSEIHQLNEYWNQIKQNDQTPLDQLKIEKITIKQVLQAKLKNIILHFLIKQDNLIDSDKFESIWNLLKLIINNNEQQNDQNNQNNKNQNNLNNTEQNDLLLDNFQVELIQEFLDYHFSIKHQQNNHENEFISEISNIKSIAYYEKKIKEKNLENKISKTFLLVIILDFFTNMEEQERIEEDMIKYNFTFILYQEALIKKQKYGDNLKNIDCYSIQAQEYFDDLNRGHLLLDRPIQEEQYNENILIKNVKKLKSSLYQTYLQFIYYKSQQNEVDKFYLEKAFEKAEQNKITIDDQTMAINSFILLFKIFIFLSLFSISLQNQIKDRFQDWLKNNPEAHFTQNLKMFNQYNFSKQSYNGIFKFFQDEVRIRFLDVKLLKLIKFLIGLENYSKALSNAFYLYSKIFGIFKDDNFENIKLSDISLQGCSFYKVNLNRSKFTNVNITNCNFVYCRLENVKWKNLQIDNFQKLQINPKYILLSKTGKWMIYYEEIDNFYRIQRKEINSNRKIEAKLHFQASRIAISENDQLLAIVSNQDILLFNTQDLKQKERYMKQTNKQDILYLAFIQNDEYLVYSNNINQVILLNINNRQEQLKILNTQAEVKVMAFSNANNLLAFSSGNQIQLYKVQEKKNSIELVQLSSNVLTLAFQINQNNILISCNQNGYIQYWDINSKQNIKVIELYNTIPLCLSRNGKFIVYKDHQNYIKLCNLEYPEVVHSFNGNQVQENLIQFSQNGDKLAIGSQVWDISRIQKNVDDNIRCIEISPDGVHYAIAQKQKILICDSKGGIGYDKLKGHTGAVNAIAYSSDAMHLVSGGDDKQVIYWNIFYTEIIHHHHHHISNVLSVAISEDNKYIASGDINGIIIIINIDNWNIIGNKIETNMNKSINSLSFGFDYENNSLYLASGNANKQIQLWKVIGQVYEEYHTFNGHTDEIRCVTFSQDGKQLSSCSNDKSIRFWDVDEKQYLFSLNGHRDHVINIKYTRNNQIWSCSKDNTLRFWDTEQKIMIIQLDSYNSNFKSFAVNPDNKYLLSLSENQSIKLWDLNGFNFKEEQIKQQKLISTIALSPDGTIIAYSGDNNIILLWNVNTKKPINHLQLGKTVKQLLFQRQNYLICVVQENDQYQIIKWDLQNNLKTELGQGSQIAISFDSQYLAYADKNKLSIIPGKPLQNEFEIQLLCFSSKDDILATIGSRKNLIIWDYKKGEIKQNMIFQGEIKLCSFTSNGKWFAYSSGDSAIKFCSTEKFGTHLQSHNKYENKGKTVKNILISNQYQIVLFDDEIAILDPTLDKIFVQSYQYNQVLSIAISSNGEKLVVLKKNFSIEFLKIEILKEDNQIQKSDVVCFYSNEELLTGCGNKIEIINLSNSQIVQSKILDVEIKSMILSQKDSKIAIADEKQIIIFDSKLKQLNSIPNQNNSIQSITLSSSGEHLAYVCEEKIMLWDLKNNKNESSRFQDFNTKPTGLIQFFNNIFKLLIVTSDKLIIFNVKRKQEEQSNDYNQSKILVISISKDDKIIAAGCLGGKIRLWNLTNGVQSDLDCKCQGVICLDFRLNNDDELASVGVDNIIRIWSIKEKREINQFSTFNISKITCIRYNPTKNQLVFIGNGGKVGFWQIDMPKLFEHYYLIEDEIINYSISRNGKKLAIQSLSDKNILIIDVESGNILQTLKKMPTQSYLKLSDEGNQLAYSSCKDLQFNVYDLVTQKLKTYEKKHKINVIDFSKDEKQLIIGYSDGTIQFYDGEKEESINYNNSSIIQLTFTNGDQIVSLNKEQKITQYKLKPLLQKVKENQSRNAIKINVFDQDKLIVKKAGSQFEILDKDLKVSGSATPDEINKSFINIENSQIFWKHRIGFIEQNPLCRTFPIIISTINQESEFTLQNNIQINEYFNRQFI